MKLESLSPVLLVIGVALAGVGQWFLQDSGNVTLGLACHGIGAVAWAVWLISRRDFDHLGYYPNAAWKYGPLVLILLVAAFLRFSHLGSFPEGMNHDSTWNGIEAAALVEGHNYKPFSLNQHGRETFYFVLISWVFRFTGITYLGIRLTSALAGLAAVAALYLCGKWLYSEGVGLLAAAVGATMVPHLILSRMGFRAILLPVTSVLAVAFLAHAFRKKSLLLGGVGGFFLGLCFHTYTAGRLMIPIAAGTAVGIAVFDWRFYLRQWKVLLVVAGMAAVTVSPLIHYHLTTADIFGREGAVGVTRYIIQEGDFGPLLRNLRLASGAFHWRVGVGHIWPPEYAFLRYLTAWSAALGIVVALTRIYRKEYLGLLIWAGGMSLAGILSIEPNINRMTGVYPTMALLAAVGASAALQGLLTVFRLKTRVPGYAIVATVIVLVNAYQADRLLFETFAQNDHFRFAFYPHITLIAERAKELAQDHTVCMSAEYANNDTVRFTTLRETGYLDTFVERSVRPAFDDFDPRIHLPLESVNGQGVAIFLQAVGVDKEQVPDLIRSFYPNVRTERIHIEDLPFPPCYIFIVSGETLADQIGLSLTTEDGSPVAGMPSSLRLPASPVRLQGMPDVALKLEGTLKMPTEYLGPLQVTGLPGAFLLLNGEVVPPDQQVFITPGLHRVTIHFQGAAERETAKLLWQPNSTLVPFPDRWLTTTLPESQLLRGYPTAPSTRVFRQLDLQFAGPGSHPGSIRNANDVALGESHLFIATKETTKIHKYDLAGNHVTTWGRRGNAGADFEIIQRIDWHDGNIYLADRRNSAIIIYDEEGTFLERFERPGEWFPTDLTVAPNGNIYFVSEDRKAVFGLNPSGQPVLFTEGEGFPGGPFEQPRAIAMGPNGLLWVTDLIRREVIALDTDGGFVASFPVPELHYRSQLAIGADGTIYVTISDRRKVLMFTPEGRLLHSEDVRSQYNPLGPLDLVEPTGIEVRGDRVYVLDSTRDFVLVGEVE